MSVRVDDLILGRPLDHPIHDSHGGVLLESGRAVTPEFKRQLKQRGVCTVRMDSRDAERLRFHVFESGPDILLDSPAVRQLDRVIDSGLLHVSSGGGALKSRIAVHGRRAYSPIRYDALFTHRTAAVARLEQMHADVLRGQTADAAPLVEIVVKLLADLACDADCLLSTVLEAPRVPSPFDHSLKMAALGMAIAAEMGLDEDHCRQIGVAGLVHDWGMSNVPADIRNAPRLLTETEFLEIRKHPVYSIELLERVTGLPAAVPIAAYQVHERPNGLGYPRGRIGERIHPFARILAVADVYASLTSERPYRPALSASTSIECLIRLAQSRDLDSAAVKALLNVLTLFPIGSYVQLDDGSVARVLRRHGDKYATPIVQVLQDAAGRRVVDRDAIVDLAEGRRTAVEALPTPGRNECTNCEGILFPVRPKK
jgi:hypothetical protein